MPAITIGFLIIRLTTHRIMPVKVLMAVGGGGTGIAVSVTCTGT